MPNRSQSRPSGACFDTDHRIAADVFSTPRRTPDRAYGLIARGADLRMKLAGELSIRTFLAKQGLPGWAMRVIRPFIDTFKCAPTVKPGSAAPAR
jgi:hypothetical protein